MFDWEDLRFFLAIARDGNTTKAARRLGVNQSTVSRRLQALESDLKEKLFTRQALGLVLTSHGERLFQLGQEMEDKAMSIQREFSGHNDRVEGLVRITSVDEIISTIIAPNMKTFVDRWPHIQVQLLSSNRTLDLSKNEADVSLRLARPDSGDLVARRVGGFGFAVFCSQAYLDRLNQDPDLPPEKLDWLVLDAKLAKNTATTWVERTYPSVVPLLRASSFKTLVASVQAGLGVALLPRPFRHIYHDLIRLPFDCGDLYNEIWLAVHQDKRHQKSIEAVMVFLEEVMAKPLK